MIPKIGSIGKGLVTISRRRRSWKAVEPYAEAIEDKTDDLSDVSNEDGYIHTYDELLADSAPSLSIPASSRRPIYVEKDYSLDQSESILSNAPTFLAKTSHHRGNDSQSSGKSTGSTRSYTNADSLDSSQSSRTKSKSKDLSRSMSFDGRPKVTRRADASFRRSWAESKHPDHRETKSKKPETSPPALFTPDNPPPPPPRPATNINRQGRRFCPPPPPPPPPPLKMGVDLKSRCMSSAESISRRNSRRLSKSLTDSNAIPDSGPRRVSFLDDHRTLKMKPSSTFVESDKAPIESITKLETDLSGLKVGQQTRRDSISSTSVVVPSDDIRTESSRRSEEFGNSINSVPKRKDSTQERFSSSMPNLSYDCPRSKPNSTRYYDDSEVPSPSRPHKSVNFENSLVRLSPQKIENAHDEDWTDILSAVEARNQASEVVVLNGSRPKKDASFNFAQPHRRSEDERPRPLPPTYSFHGDFSRSSNENGFQDSVISSHHQRNMTESSFREDLYSKTTTHLREQDALEEAKSAVVSTPTKDTSTKGKILSKISLPFRSRNGSIEEDTKEKSSNKPKYDKNGRCKKHPSIIIAKPRPFAKGWDIIRACPRCSRVSGDSSVQVDELLAPSKAKKYDWQLPSSFASPKSLGCNTIEGASDFLAKSAALQDSMSSSEAGLNSSARSGSSRQFNNSTTTSSRRHLKDSSRTFDSSIIGSDHFDSSRHYSGNCSSGQLGTSTSSSSMQHDNAIRRSGSLIQFDISRQLDSLILPSGSSMKLDHDRSRSNSFMGGCPSQLDYSTRSEGRLNSSRQLDCSTRSEGCVSRSDAPSTRSGSSAVVSKMPFKTPWGEAGWYSGEVDSSGVPNGEGRMRFKSGEQHSGLWSNGYSEQFMETSRRMKRGFGGNVAPWKASSHSDLSYIGYSSRRILT